MPSIKSRRRSSGGGGRHDIRQVRPAGRPVLHPATASRERAAVGTSRDTRVLGPRRCGRPQAAYVATTMPWPTPSRRSHELGRLAAVIGHRVCGPTFDAVGKINGVRSRPSDRFRAFLQSRVVHGRKCAGRVAKASGATCHKVPGKQPFPNGARGTRTPDLLGAIQALSQLSYSPGRRHEPHGNVRV